MNGISEAVRRIGCGCAVATGGSPRSRYCIDISTPYGIESCYYGSPIYTPDGSLADGKITRCGSIYKWACSNSDVNVSGNRIEFTSAAGNVGFEIGTSPFTLDGGRLVSNTAAVVPTVGGAKFSVKRNAPDISFEIYTEKADTYARSNTKYLAAMIEEYRPLFILSAIGMRRSDNSLSPFEIDVGTAGSGVYTVHIANGSQCCNINPAVGGCLCGDSCSCEYVFEISMYEQRLFLDTTVDSAHSCENNVYGAIAYIGKTDKLGTQWLYARPSSVISLNPAGPITSAEIAIPLIYRRGSLPESYSLPAHFCGVGTTWDDGRQTGVEKIPITERNGCLILDIYDRFVDRESGRYKYFDGILLRAPEESSSSLCVIPTGDNTAEPWMLRIGYRQ